MKHSADTVWECDFCMSQSDLEDYIKNIQESKKENENEKRNT